MSRDTHRRYESQYHLVNIRKSKHFKNAKKRAIASIWKGWGRPYSSRGSARKSWGWIGVWERNTQTKTLSRKRRLRGAVRACHWRFEHCDEGSELILEAKGGQTIGSNGIMMRSGSRGWAQGTREASEIMYSPVLRHRVCGWARGDVHSFRRFPQSLTVLRPSSRAKLENSLTTTLLPRHRAQRMLHALPLLDTYQPLKRDLGGFQMPMVPLGLLWDVPVLLNFQATQGCLFIPHFNVKRTENCRKMFRNFPLDNIISIV